jgi:hypothetical protein
MRPTDRARLALKRAQVVLGVAAVPVAVSVGVLAAGRPPSTPSLMAMPAGLLVGFGILLTCWALLAAACAAWRSRLAAMDRRDWTNGWARVEPVWSGRVAG